MFKRIYKTTISILLCLAFTMPANAAVSVSDGSAFVTKAEFSADLNNLSNRMAQLENSLDAKIDSLVSAYLTKNGIWNGAKQVTQSYTVKYKDLWSPIKSAMITICGITDSSAQSQADVVSWVSVPKCDKSGLLVLSTQCNHTWNYTCNEQQGDYKHSIWQGCFSGYLQVDKKLTGSTYEMLGTTTGAIGAFIEFYYNGSNESPAECPYATISASNAVYNTQVFVSKNDEIVSRMVIAYSGRRAGVTRFNFDVAYSYSCSVDKVCVGSSTSTLSNTDITWNCAAHIY